MNTYFPVLPRTKTAARKRSAIETGRKIETDNLSPVSAGFNLLDDAAKCPCCDAGKDQLRPMWDIETPMSWVIYCLACRHVGPEARTIDEAAEALKTQTHCNTAVSASRDPNASRTFDGIDGYLIAGAMARAYLWKTPVYN